MASPGPGVCEQSVTLTLPGRQVGVPLPPQAHGPPCCDSVKGVSGTSRPLAHVTDQEAVLELGHIREARNYFYYGFRGSGGLQPRVSVSSSGQMAPVLALLHPLPAALGPVLTCFPGPSGAVTGLPGALLGLERWEAQGRGSCWPPEPAQGLD